MTSEEQLDRWVAGESVHNEEWNECCPDFSCCRPELLWPRAKREFFRDYPECREEMLFEALAQAIATYTAVSGKRVHLTG